MGNRLASTCTCVCACITKPHTCTCMYAIHVCLHIHTKSLILIWATVGLSIASTSPILKLHLPDTLYRVTPTLSPLLSTRTHPLKTHNNKAIETICTGLIICTYNGILSSLVTQATTPPINTCESAITTKSSDDPLFSRNVLIVSSRNDSLYLPTHLSF